MKISEFPFTKTVLEIAEAADKGKLSLAELNCLWPTSVNGIEFFDQIYLDIEDAVEHFPGKFISGEPDIETWRDTGEHYVLCLDMELLKSEEELSILHSRRFAALEDGRENNI